MLHDCCFVNSHTSLRNEWLYHFLLHKVNKNESDRAGQWMEKWHEILHVFKWMCFGGHLNFAARQSKYVVSTKMKATTTQEKSNSFLVIFFPQHKPLNEKQIIEIKHSRFKFILQYVMWQRLLRSDVNFSWSWPSDHQSWPGEILNDHFFPTTLWGHSRLGYSFWASNGLRTFLHNFTCLVCLDLYCETYFGSFLHFILHIEYTDKVNLEGIGSSKISFWFLKGHLGVLS